MWLLKNKMNGSGRLFAILVLHLSPYKKTFWEFNRNISKMTIRLIRILVSDKSLYKVDINLLFHMEKNYISTNKGIITVYFVYVMLSGFYIFYESVTETDNEQRRLFSKPCYNVLLHYASAQILLVFRKFLNNYLTSCKLLNIYINCSQSLLFNKGNVFFQVNAIISYIGCRMF
jgi:hypothetical protein